MDGSGTALDDLVERFGRGDRRALARAISIVEDERPGFGELLARLHGRGMGAARVGFTGPPGAGKSTLLSVLVPLYRERGEEVGVVAVDPTSPFTGGALLGDRIRMNELATDQGVFIRSMATRGALGGLAAATRGVVDVLDAFGFQRILVETVGVGQGELEVARAADTVVVVLVPESGDAIQVMKAGLMEIADVFVVNKADRPGADRLARELQAMLHMRRGEALRDIPAHHGVDLGEVSRRLAAGKREAAPAGAGGPGEEPPPWWTVPVLRTVAAAGEGVDGLLEAVDAHRSFLRESGELRRRARERTLARIREAVEGELRRRVWGSDEMRALLEEGLARIEEGEENPYGVAERIVGALLGAGPPD